MTDKNISKTPTTKQEKVSSINDRHTYDIDGLDDFISLVFHSELSADENILCWATNSVPAYPSDDAELLHSLKRVPVAKALYYGTSTCERDMQADKLFNRKALFKRLHVIVLDDIGTKVPVSKLPEELKPTYIIESSEGNYQYGYVLETPISVLEHAEALIQLAYESGYTDAGGKMATKLVRLPGGENGKPGEKGRFHVKLISDDGPLWTPDRLLEVMDLGITWDAVLEDTSIVAKQTASNSVGATAWSPLSNSNMSLDGIVDPVLE